MRICTMHNHGAPTEVKAIRQVVAHVIMVVGRAVVEVIAQEVVTVAIDERMEHIVAKTLLVHFVSCACP